MTYRVVWRKGPFRSVEAHYDEVSDATIAYIGRVTAKCLVALYGHDGGIIATYDPPDETAVESVRAVPHGGSQSAYWYAIGQIDATVDLGAATDDDARLFSLHVARHATDDLRGEWETFLWDSDLR